MKLLANYSLRAFNTFGIDCMAEHFSTFSNTEELDELRSLVPAKKILVLGGGSNILFTKNPAGLVLKNEVKGIDILHEDQTYVYVRAGAGENWHQFVLYCIKRGWGGAENLSLIPGNVGAAPMQNIGAYGAELKDVFWDLEAWHIEEKKRVTFTLSDCEFAYRESVFKKKYKEQFIILSVTFRLRKKPVFNISYGAIQQELEKMGITELSLKAISDAVINIRLSKLPDPALLGNAGSFFKNPVVDTHIYNKLKLNYPTMPAYDNPDGTKKLAAGWLIENCGPDGSTSWKGYRIGDAGCYQKQALVLVNYGSATGNEIYYLSEKIMKSVKEKFQITLEREVNVI